MKKLLISLFVIISLLYTQSTVAFANSCLDADLIVSDVIMSTDTPNMGEEVEFSVVVQNIGDSEIRGNIPVRVSVNGDEIAYTDTFYAEIPAGKSAVIPADKGENKTTWTASEETAQIKAEVNFNDSLSESNTDNNVFNKDEDILAVSLPGSIETFASGDVSDLAVTSVMPSIATVYDGDSIFIAAVIRNLGTKSTNEMIDITFMADGKFVETVTHIGAIPAGGIATVKTNLLRSMFFGLHNFTVKVNGTRTTEELDFTNNILKTRTTVIDAINPQPFTPETDIKDIDLTVSEIRTVPEEYQIGEDVKLVAVVNNGGADTTNGMFKVDFNIDGKTYSSDYQTTLISADGTAVVESATPWVAVSGVKNVSATVNRDMVIYENDYSNNKVSDKIESMRGARVSFKTYEAEDADTNAQVLVSKDRLAGELAGEASGRSAVKLSKTGDYVEWTATAPANSIVMRGSMPDIGLEATRSISVYLNGKKVDSLTMSTKYSWLYGDRANPSKDAALGEPRHIYDDCRVLLDETIAIGDRVKIQKDATDTAGWYSVDFIDLEMVAPPLEKPDYLVSIADFQNKDTAVSIRKAMDYALQNGYRGIWIPAGDWACDTKVQMPSKINDNATGNERFEISGAGMWYTRLYATSYGTTDWGNFGFNCRGKTAYYHDFMLDGMNKIRTEGGKPFCNGYGKNTTIENVWIEHTTCGFWCGGAVANFSGGTPQDVMQSKNLLIKDCRVRNTGADGMNLSNSTTNATVCNVECRSTGDDCFAMWSTIDPQINPNGSQGNTIKYCSAKFPWRANCYAIYGGKDNTVTDCLAVDTLTYPAILCSDKEFQSITAGGTITFRRMDIIRCSGIFFDDRCFPAVSIKGNGKDAEATVLCEDLRILDTLYAPIGLSKTNTAIFRNITIDGFAKYTTPPANPDAVNGIYMRDMAESTYTFENVNFYNMGPKAAGLLSNGFQSNRATIINCNWNENGLKN